MIDLGDSGGRRWRSKYREERPSGDIAKRKFLGLRLFVLLLFAILTTQLVRMQVYETASYQVRAEHNRLRLLPVMPARGLIYDRRGELLVRNVPAFSAGVVPADLPDEERPRVFAELGKLLNVDPLAIGAAIDLVQSRQNPFTPVIVKHDLDQETAFRLREALQDLPGVQLVVEAKRQYVYGPLLSHVVGFMGRLDEEEYDRLHASGYELNDYIGKAGVEVTYESVLRGTPGRKEAEVDALGREIRTLDSVEAKPGLSLQLSVDLDLQRRVTEILKEAMGLSLNAAAVVMDVRTGEVLAMVSLPAYDDNIFSGQIDDARLKQILDDPAKPLVNHAITEMYPPGSIFKQITAAAALQEGVANVNTTITSYGSLTVRNQYDPNVVYVFKDWSALGTLNFYGGVAMSSDVYFYCLAGGCNQDGREYQGLGAERLAAYARAFGLGSPTGIDLPGESAGLVPNPQWKEDTVGEPWVLGDSYNFGIGQGYLATTAIQMVRVTAAIANGGDVLVPRVVRALLDANGATVRTLDRNVARHLDVSAGNLATVREAMRQAVAWGTAKTGAVPGVAIGGKTGTAEFGMPKPDGTHDTHGWYTGFAPADDPQVAVAVFLQRGNGSMNAGPVASKILDYYFHRQNLAGAAP